MKTPKRNPALLVRILVVGVVAALGLGACSSTKYDALYLSITVDGEVTPPTHFVARAMTHTSDGALITTLTQDLTGEDIVDDRYVLQLNVPLGSPYATEAVISVVAYHDDAPVASWAGSLDLTGKETRRISLQPIVPACDLDGDGFENCLADAACCDKGEADYGHDCDDASADVFPFAPTESCRDCADEDQDGVIDCLEDILPGEDVVGGEDVANGEDIIGEDIIDDLGEPDICEPACPDTGACDMGDGCGGICGCPGSQVCKDGWCVVKGMTRVPGDSFWMGCNTALDENCEETELPQREVDVPAFDMDTLEVTNAAYQECVDAGTCTQNSYDDGTCFVIDPDDATWIAKVVPSIEDFTLRGPDNPVTCLSWDQARAYCEDWRCPDCRLCTEAEFEMGARGSCLLYEGKECKTAMPTFPWGEASPLVKDGMDEDPGNFGDETAGAKYPFLGSYINGYTDGYAETSPVGVFPDGQSKYGIRDLSGNVWEWVQDCWHDDYTDAPTDGSAWEDGDCSKRVRRGGAWVSDAASVRSGVRGVYDATFKVDLVGFRCCRSAN